MTFVDVGLDDRHVDSAVTMKGLNVFLRTKLVFSRWIVRHLWSTYTGFPVMTGIFLIAANGVGGQDRMTCATFHVKVHDGSRSTYIFQADYAYPVPDPGRFPHATKPLHYPENIFSMQIPRLLTTFVNHIKPAVNSIPGSMTSKILAVHKQENSQRGSSKR